VGNSVTGLTKIQVNDSHSLVKKILSLVRRNDMEKFSYIVM